MKRTSKMTEALLFGVILVFVLVFVGNAFLGDAKAQSCVQPPLGVVSWWPGNGNGSDIIDGNASTLLNGATFAAGKVGQAFSLDGMDDFVNVADNANLKFGATESFTIDAWIRTTKSATV